MVSSSQHEHEHEKFIIVGELIEISVPSELNKAPYDIQ